MTRSGRCRLLLDATVSWFFLQPMCLLYFCQGIIFIFYPLSDKEHVVFCFLIGQVPFWEILHKEARSMNQVCQASTSGCSLAGEEQLVPSPALNNILMRAHPSSGTTSLSHLKSPVSLIVLYSWVWKIPHWQFSTDLLFQMKLMWTSSQAMFPGDSYHQSSNPHLC